MKVLFLANHRPGRAPGQRFRFEQYLSFLSRNGVECQYSWLLDENDDRWFYESSFGKKILVGSKCTLKRFIELFDGTLRRTDIIFVFREALFIGPPFFEIIAKRYNKKIIFDFDDAIWLSQVSKNNKSFSWLKWKSKTDYLMQLSDIVIAGNSFLAEYAKKFAKNVEIVPTTIDTDLYIPRPRSLTGQFCIGWSGSFSTTSHLCVAQTALKHIKTKYGEKIKIKIIGDATYEDTLLDVKGLPWSLSTEIEDLQTFDLGIMPLPDDDWCRGKCGLKGLQYMALGIPTVMSPVGVNSSIIIDGINGFLARTESDWIKKITTVIENPHQRTRLGDEARKTVVLNYSVSAWRDKYLSILRSLA